MDSTHSGWSPAAISSLHGNEASGCIEDEEFRFPDYHLSKTNCVPCIYNRKFCKILKYHLWDLH